MLTYNRIHEKCPRAHILHSYDYVQSNQWAPVHSHHTLLHTHMIRHTKSFLHQPICQGIRFRSAYKLHQKILYEQALSQTTPLHTRTIHTPLYTSTYSYNSTYEDTFLTNLSPVPENIVIDKTVTFATTKPTHAHFTRHHTLLNTTTFTHQNNSIQKQIPSNGIIFLLVESETSRFKHKFESDHFPLG